MLARAQPLFGVERAAGGTAPSAKSDTSLLIFILASGMQVSESDTGPQRAMQDRIPIQNMAMQDDQQKAMHDRHGMRYMTAGV